MYNISDLVKLDLFKLIVQILILALNISTVERIANATARTMRWTATYRLYHVQVTIFFTLNRNGFNFSIDIKEMLTLKLIHFID